MNDSSARSTPAKERPTKEENKTADDNPTAASKSSRPQPVVPDSGSATASSATDRKPMVTTEVGEVEDANSPGVVAEDDASDNASGEPEPDVTEDFRATYQEIIAEILKTDADDGVQYLAVRNAMRAKLQRNMTSDEKTFVQTQLRSLQ